MDQPSFTKPAGPGAGAARPARLRLAGLDADVFRHPLDRQATNNLKKVPGFDKAVAKVIEWGVERIEYVEHTASGVRAGPRQLPRVHGLLREACAVLDVPEPELYVRQGSPNAYTSGHNHPYIVVFTDLIDLMSQDELLGVLAHETGHIKCGHVLYKTMARVFGGAAAVGMRRVNPMTAAVGMGIRAALKSWDRASEFTADRAAMLATQDLEACVGMMMKLAGGVRSDEMSTEAFLDQARHLDVLAGESKISRLHRFQLRVGSGHPLVVERARHFHDWITSGEPAAIVTRYTAPGTPAGATPGTPAGATPGTPAGATPGTPAGATPGTPAGATPGATAGATPGATAGATATAGPTVPVQPAEAPAVPAQPTVGTDGRY